MGRKAQSRQDDDWPLVFSISMDGNHSGASVRFPRLRETAREYSFIVAQLGIEQ